MKKVFLLIVCCLSLVTYSNAQENKEVNNNSVNKTAKEANKEAGKEAGKVVNTQKKSSASSDLFPDDFRTEEEKALEQNAYKGKITKAIIETNMGNMVVMLYNDTPLHRDNFIKLAKAGHYDGTLFYRVVKDFVIQGGSSDSRNAIAGQNIGFGKGIIIDSEIKKHHYHKKGALAAPRQPDRENFFKESDIAQFYIVHGRVYPRKELDYIEKKVNTPIKNAIYKKYMTPEKKATLDSLKKLKKVKEFREIAEEIKRNITFEWQLNSGKLFMPEKVKNDYATIGGVHHLDREYTVFGEVIEGLEVIDKIANLKTDSNDRPLQDIRIKVRILN